MNTVYLFQNAVQKACLTKTIEKQIYGSYFPLIVNLLLLLKSGSISYALLIFGNFVLT